MKARLLIYKRRNCNSQAMRKTTSIMQFNARITITKNKLQMIAQAKRMRDSQKSRQKVFVACDTQDAVVAFPCPTVRLSRLQTMSTSQQIYIIGKLHTRHSWPTHTHTQTSLASVPLAIGREYDMPNAGGADGLRNYYENNMEFA